MRSFGGDGRCIQAMLRQSERILSERSLGSRKFEQWGPNHPLGGSGDFGEVDEIREVLFFNEKRGESIPRAILPDSNEFPTIRRLPPGGPPGLGENFSRKKAQKTQKGKSGREMPGGVSLRGNEIRGRKSRFSLNLCGRKHISLLRLFSSPFGKCR